MATNDIGRVTPIWRGFFSAAATYELNDIVIDTAGSVWWHKSHEQTTGAVPGSGDVWDAVIDMSVFSGLIQAAITTAQTALEAAQAAVSEVSADTERAETAAQNAENSALSASESAAGVGAYAQAAEAAKNAAQTAASQAAASASGAGTSASSAGSSAQAAEAAKTAAQTAAAEAAGSAETASGAVTVVEAKKTEAIAAIEAKGAEVLESIPQDYSALSEDVSDLKNAIDYATGVKAIPIQVQNKYLKIVNNAIDVEHPQTSSTGYGYSITSCSAGDKFCVNGVSSANEPMAWVFTDSSYTILLKSANSTTITNEIITAPEDTAYLIIHDKSPYRTSFGGKSLVYLKKAVNDLPFTFYNIFNGCDEIYKGKRWLSGADLRMTDDSDYDICRVIIDESQKYYIYKPYPTAYSNAVRFADDQDTYLSTASELDALNTPPTGAYYLYVRVLTGELPVVVPKNDLSKYQDGYHIELGDDVYIGDLVSLKQDVDEIEKTYNPTYNLADRTNFTENHYMGEDGATHSSSTYFYTNRIKVQENEVIVVNGDIRFLTAFLNGTVKNPSGITRVDGKFTVPSGIDEIVISGYTSGIDTFMVSKNKWLPYIPYGISTDNKSLKIDNVGSIYGKECAKEQLDSLEADTVYELIYPKNIMVNENLSIKCYFETFDSLTVGYGNGTGKYFQITPTEIKSISAGTVGNTVAHGLTISTYLMAVIHVDGNGEATITINTLSGSYSTTYAMDYGKKNYPFILPTMDITDITICATCANFKNALWWFGDSYSGLDSSRVLGQIKNLGYLENILFDALPGQRTYYSATQGGYYEFFECLKYGTPKFIIWALGMNDSIENYSKYVQRVIDTCKVYGITPILVKPPIVPDVDNSDINTWIDNSGERYIDWNGAVGANSSGVWYAGYMSNDNVHPSTIGAKALAMQTLVDAPEIMQYKD